MFRNDLRFWLSCGDGKNSLKTHPIAFQNAQNSYKVKTFLTHFAIVLKTFFLSPAYSVQLLQAGFLQHRSRSRVIAPYFLHFAHLRTQLDTWDGVLWEKVHCRRRWVMRCSPQQGWGEESSTMRAHLKIYACISMKTTVRVNFLNILPVFISF